MLVLDGSLFALVLSGLLALGYELFALFTRKAPTITDVVRGWEGTDAAHKGIVSAVGLVHFLGGF